MPLVRLFAALSAALVFTAPASADGFSVRKVSETATTITLGWDSQPGDGYRFYADGVAVSRTFDPSRTSVRFSKGASSYRIEVLHVSAGDSGFWPIPDPPPLPGSVVGNLWVDADGGSCSRSGTPQGYQDSTACPSFAAAYSAAVSGDVIGVMGVLGVQKFAGGYQSSQGSGTKDLTFRGERGNKVRQINFGSPNLTFDGINVDGEGTKTSGALFENGGDPFVFKNGSIGDVVDEKGALVTGSGVVFENVLFHDAVLRTAGTHMECVWAAAVPGMVIRNSIFRNCAVFDVFINYPDYWSPLPPPFGGIVLEGNTFGAPVPGTYSVFIGYLGLNNSYPLTGWRIRNNSFGAAPSVAPETGSDNVFCGNTGSAPVSWQAPC